MEKYRFSTGSPRSRRNLSEKLRKIDRLSELLDRHAKLPTFFTHLKEILRQMKFILAAYSNSEEHFIVHKEMFEAVYDVLKRHLFWSNKPVDVDNLHELSTLPSADVDVALVVLGLGNLPSALVDRFIDEVVSKAERRIRRAFKEKRSECAALVVRDLKNQLLMTKNFLNVGLPSYYLPLLEKVSQDVLPVGISSLCEWYERWSEQITVWSRDSLSLC